MPVEEFINAFPTQEFIKIFFSIFVVMDPLGNLPIFYTLTNKLSAKDRTRNINRAVFIASILLFLFLFFGAALLGYFGISIGSFEVAGGVILAIIGTKVVLGLRLTEERAQKYQMAVVPMATPLITGPATITTILLLVTKYNYTVVLIASAVNLFVTWIILHQTELLFKILGRQGSDIVARLFGLIIVALAVEFIRQGLNVV